MSLFRWALVLPPLAAERAAAGHSRRVRELVFRHLGAVCRTARRLGIPERDLEDLAQEVLVVVVRRLADIEPDKERAFMVGTTLRLVANHRRRRRRRPEHPSGGIDDLSVAGLAAAQQTPEHARAHGERSVEMAQQLALLDAALAEMTEAQREAFVCAELEELTASETAVQLGITEASVVSRVRRAREVLWSVCERHGYAVVRAGRGSGKGTP
jgi:RNA polymerase sigma-70 factor, ECF subfamily